jgi:hypothetical protein
MPSFGKKLAGEFDAEFARLANDWYLKWHELARGEPVEVDDFRGGLLRAPTTAFDPVTEHAYWTAIRRYTDGKIGETFARIESEIGFRTGGRAAYIAEEGSIALRNFLEKLLRHAVYTEYRLQARGYPDERYLASRRDDSILEEVQRRKVALLKKYAAMSWAERIARAMVGSFANWPVWATLAASAAAVGLAVVFCYAGKIL